LNILSIIVFIPLQILFVPLAVIGALLVFYKQVIVSRKLALSLTAIEVVNGRWTMHVFGLRKDEATAKLAKVLPNTSLTGLWACLFPLWVKAKISGRHSIYPRVPEPGSETLADLITARTLYIDRIIERGIESAEQFVVLGAGYDTRAYGELQKQGISFFELDQPAVQNHKIACLDAAGINRDHVSYVSVEFGKDSIVDKLIESGFNTAKQTVFLWEGVTLYLSEEDVRKTLREIRDATGPGSVIIVDIYADRIVGWANKGYMKKTLDQTDEGLNFSLDLSADYEKVLAEFVESESLSIGEAVFMGSSNKQGPFVVVAELK